VLILDTMTQIDQRCLKLMHVTVQPFCFLQKQQIF